MLSIFEKVWKFYIDKIPTVQGCQTLQNLYLLLQKYSDNSTAFKLTYYQ